MGCVMINESEKGSESYHINHNVLVLERMRIRARESILLLEQEGEKHMTKIVKSERKEGEIEVDRRREK